MQAHEKLPEVGAKLSSAAAQGESFRIGTSWDHPRIAWRLGHVQFPFLLNILVFGSRIAKTSQLWHDSLTHGKQTWREMAMKNFQKLTWFPDQKPLSLRNIFPHESYTVISTSIVINKFYYHIQNLCKTTHVSQNEHVAGNESVNKPCVFKLIHFLFKAFQCQIFYNAKWFQTRTQQQNSYDIARIICFRILKLGYFNKLQHQIHRSATDQDASVHLRDVLWSERLLEVGEGNLKDRKSITWPWSGPDMQWFFFEGSRPNCTNERFNVIGPVQ